MSDEPRSSWQGPSDWTRETPSDVLLALGLLRLLQRRGAGAEPEHAEREPEPEDDGGR